jgi:glutamate-ammonia-ligase adenylyltransferase
MPGAATPEVLRRLGELGLVADGARLAEIHELYSTVLQVMSAALADPFKDEGWTDAFRDLLAQLTNAPSFGRLAEDIGEMQRDVSAAAERWYARARGL